MRLPIDIAPPVAISENRYRIRQPDAINPTRPVAPNASFRQTYYRKLKSEGREAESAEMAEEDIVQEQVTLGAHPVEEVAAEAERRHGQDRRQEGRRIAEEPVILDTRSVDDRRVSRRREGDLGTHIDELA